MSLMNLNNSLSISDLLHYCNVNRFEKRERMELFGHNSFDMAKPQQQQHIGKKNSVMLPFIDNQPFSNCQSLENDVKLASDLGLNYKSKIKHGEKLMKINSCINKGSVNVKNQSDAHSKLSHLFNLCQESATTKENSNYINGNNENFTPPVILRYQHKSRDMSFHPLLQTNDNSKTNHPENSFDSVDFVFQANRPEDLKLPSLNSLSPILNQQSCNYETKENEITQRNRIREHSWIEWDISQEPRRLTNISEQGSDVLSFMQIKSQSSESFESACSSVPHILDPDIYKNAYIMALKYARVRHFLDAPLGQIVTKPFVFSYFDLLRTNQRRKTNQTKKFNQNEMELIFRTTKMDDFIMK